jgi:hypothetical protein
MQKLILRRWLTISAQNWPVWKKNLNLGILVLASFAGNLANVANAGGFVPQAVLYQKSLVEVSYSVSFVPSLISTRWNDILTRYSASTRLPLASLDLPLDL